MASTHFIVHRKNDTVGIVVAEAGVTRGDQLTGWIMDGDETVALTARDDVPLGHKIALKDVATGETVVEYGHDIGMSVADIGTGCHVHTHNLKTRRW